MCTVTAIPIADGFRLACNRDERRDRPTARPPAIHVLQHRRAVFPVDPIGPGTWAGVNDAGLAAALLNRTLSLPGGPHAGGSRSRGLIIPSLLDADSIDRAVAMIDTLRVETLAPFRLLIAQAARAAVVESDGVGSTHILVDFHRPLMLTSSSLGDAAVDGPRRRLFETMFEGAPPSWPVAQQRFHRHQWRARPEISVLMRRDDARTISRTTITVGADAIRLRYRAFDTNEDVLVEMA